MRKNFSVNIINTRSAREPKTKESAVEGPTVPAIEIDLETPDQSVDEVERKTTESTPMPNAEEQEKKTTGKSKKFGTVSAITTEAKQDDEQIKCGATTNHEKTTSLELDDLMAKLHQIGNKLKWSEEDQQMLKKEIRYNKNENLDNCFNLARATEE